jgi:hypothetical protein
VVIIRKTEQSADICINLSRTKGEAIQALVSVWSVEEAIRPGQETERANIFTQSKNLKKCVGWTQGVCRAGKKRSHFGTHSDDHAGCQSVPIVEKPCEEEKIKKLAILGCLSKASILAQSCRIDCAEEARVDDEGSLSC